MKFFYLISLMIVFSQVVSMEQPSSMPVVKQNSPEFNEKIRAIVKAPKNKENKNEIIKRMNALDESEIKAFKLVLLQRLKEQDFEEDFKSPFESVFNKLNPILKKYLVQDIINELKSLLKIPFYSKIDLKLETMSLPYSVIAFSPANNLLAAVSKSIPGLIEVWIYKKQFPLINYNTKIPTISSLAFMGDKILIASSKYPLYYLPVNEKNPSTYIFLESLLENEINDLIVTDVTGSLLALKNSETTNQITIVDLIAQSKIQVNSTFDHIQAMVFSPDKKLLLVSSLNGNIEAWTIDGNPAAVPSNREIEIEGGITSLAFTPDDQIIFLSFKDKELKIWNVVHKEQEGVLSFDKPQVIQIITENESLETAALSPDGSHLALSLSNGIYFYEISKLRTDLNQIITLPAALLLKNIEFTKSTTNEPFKIQLSSREENLFKTFPPSLQDYLLKNSFVVIEENIFKRWWNKFTHYILSWWTAPSILKEKAAAYIARFGWGQSKPK